MWHDINVKKPKYNEKVLVRSDNDVNTSFFIDHLNNTGEWHRALCNTVTHWCHLPDIKCRFCGK